jgi:GPH family glycoside/pentoside/hexuronide:cation symporter
MPTMTVAQKLTYSIPHLALSFSGMFMGQRLLSFYNPSADDIEHGAVALVSTGILPMLFIFGGLIDALADPPIGYWSDRCRSRFGRRMPFIMMGTPIMVAGFMAHWFPPDQSATMVNAVYIAVVLFFYKIAFTAVLGPYEALLPEIAADEATRISLSVYVSVAFIVGNALGAAAGALEEHWADGATLLGVRLDSGVEVLGVLCAFCLLAFLLPALNIRETPRSKAKEIEDGFVTSVLSVYRNGAFVRILTMATLAQMAIAMVVANLDYFCKEVLQRPPGQEGWVLYGEANIWRTWLFVILFAGALISMPIVNVIANRVSKKGMMMLSGGVIAVAICLLPMGYFISEPAILAIASMALLAFPMAVIFVLARVFIADVADYDQVLSGKRREGILNGAMALVNKIGLGIGIALVSVIKGFGDSREDPTGILMVAPIAAVLLGLGVFLFRRFPEKEMLAAIHRFRQQSAPEVDA